MNPSSEPALRFRGGDRHHLFNNHGTWFLRYCVRDAAWLKAERRITASLGTKDLSVAQERRDVFFAHLRLQRELSAGAGTCTWSVAA